VTRLRGQLNCCRPFEPEPDNTGGGKNTDKTKIIFSTRIIAEVVIFVALATALSFIIIYTLPQGGSITAGSMVPILWLALRRGPKIGLFAGAVYGVVQLIVMPYAYNPAQVLFDYPFAFGCLGLAGFFQKWPIVGVVVGITGRFLMHFISGVVWFAPVYAPELNPFVYSAVYNGSYLIPEMAISVFIIYLLQKSNALNIYL
jgi:thiamine transporter